MLNEKMPASKELQDADTALRRAAVNAKKLAEQQGTPYVVVENTLPLLNSGEPITSKTNNKAA
jgi:hypothetical protein